MAEKGRPIFTVLVILGVVILFLGAALLLVLTLFPSASTFSFGEKVGVVTIEGAISDARAITQQLVEMREDKGVKAVVLRINSPGGSVGPTQEISREIQKTTQHKTVIASLGEVAASGGYYIAAGAEKIVANPGTITGSIGVLMQFVRFQELLEKIGVEMEVVKSGEFKDIGSPHRPLTKREKAMIDELLSDIETQFVHAVSDGRGLSLEAVRRIADGQIFSGTRAKELGLVDRLGNFRDAVDLAKQMAHIKGKVKLVYPKERRTPIWDALLESAIASLAERLEAFRTRIDYRWDGFSAPGS